MSYDAEAENYCCNILVVEDDVAVTRALPFCFRDDEGISLIFAATVTAATERLEDPEQEFDLVLLDRDLADGECGEKLLPLIKKCKLMLVLISGNNQYLRQKAKEAGVVVAGELAKPFNVDAFRECIYATLGVDALTDD